MDRFWAAVANFSCSDWVLCRGGYVLVSLSQLRTFIFSVSIKEENRSLFGIQGAEGWELPIKVRCPGNDFVTVGFCLSQTGGNHRVHRGSGVINP